jgi:hypothetical protein
MDINAAFDGGGLAAFNPPPPPVQSSYQFASQPSLQQHQHQHQPPPMPQAAPPSKAAAEAAAAHAQQQQTDSLLSAAPYAGASADPGGLLAPAEPTGFFDRLGAKRRELVKLLVLALMVTLGIAVHRFCAHYLDEWIGGSDFSDRQEIAVRAVYPVAVALSLWVIKAYQS